MCGALRLDYSVSPYSIVFIIQLFWIFTNSILSLSFFSLFIFRIDVFASDVWAFLERPNFQITVHSYYFEIPRRRVKRFFTLRTVMLLLMMLLKMDQLRKDNEVVISRSSSQDAC